MFSLGPTDCVRSFENFDLDVVYDRTGRAAGDQMAVTFDIDGLVTGHHDERVPDRFLRKFNELGADERIVAMAAVSNAGADRDERARDLVHQASEAFERGIACVTSNQVGSGKPRRPIFKVTGEVLGVELKDVCHVGDQLVKDVWGAKLAGCGATVLAPPYRVNREHPLTHYLQRPFEASIRPFLGLPFRAANLGLQSSPSIEARGKEVTAGGYRNAKRICYAGALTLAVAGGVEIGDNQALGHILAGVFGEGLGFGLLNSAALFLGYERYQATLENTQRIDPRMTAEEASLSEAA